MHTGLGEGEGRTGGRARGRRTHQDPADSHNFPGVAPPRPDPFMPTCPQPRPTATRTLPGSQRKAAQWPHPIQPTPPSPSSSHTHRVTRAHPHPHLQLLVLHHVALVEEHHNAGHAHLRVRVCAGALVGGWVGRGDAWTTRTCINSGDTACPRRGHARAASAAGTHVQQTAAV